MLTLSAPKDFTNTSFATSTQDMTTTVQPSVVEMLDQPTAMGLGHRHQHKFQGHLGCVRERRVLHEQRA